MVNPAESKFPEAVPSEPEEEGLEFNADTLGLWLDQLERMMNAIHAGWLISDSKALEEIQEWLKVGNACLEKFKDRISTA